MLSPHCVNLSVSNLDGAEAWYRDKLDFERVHRKRFPGLEIAFMRNGDFEIELVQFDGSRPGTPFPDPQRHAEIQGITHFAFRVADAEAMMERLGARGVPVLFGPKRYEELNLELFFIRDPEGNLVKFVQRLR